MNRRKPEFVKSLVIQNVHIVDPSNQLDEKIDLFIKDGKVRKWGKNLKEENVQILDGKKFTLLPGFVDLHVHFREPGFEQKETIESGVKAALAGGFVGCVTMPNTQPSCDNAQVVKYQIERGALCNFNLLPAGTLTHGREGKKVSEMAEMKAAGAVAVTDDGNWLSDSGVARRVYEYAATYGLLIVSHAEDFSLSFHGIMNESIESTKLGLRGKPNAAEDIATARDIELARLIGCRIHFQHVSTRGAVEMIRRAKAEGLKVTGEATPHHIALTDQAFSNYDTSFKVNPPLRAEEDRKALIKGLEDGTLDIIATDHAPHAPEEKDQDIENAPSGVIGLESCFGVVMTELYHGRKWKLADIVRKMSLGPSELIGEPNLGKLKTGMLANFILVDPSHDWTFTPEHIRSKSKNSCFLGKKLKGKVFHTFANGEQHIA